MVYAIFTLAVIITLMVSPEDVRIHRFDFEYEFHTVTGCYLTGATEVATLIPSGVLELPDNVTIEIECEQQ